jgi:dimethylargininase
LVREPGNSYSRCISCHPLKASIDLGKARLQHAEYRKVLRDLGLEVITVPRDDTNADSCFVEDNAVVRGKRALMCRMARKSRRNEVEAVADVLGQYLKIVHAKPPATVEGGDVIHFEDRLISGVSQRTNPAGVSQMSEWLEVKVDSIRDLGMVHLKSYATYLGRNTLIVSSRFAKHDLFRQLTLIELPDKEAYAADTLAIGDTVLMASGRPVAQSLVKQAGFKVVPLDVSEIEKCEGALTCLSILF